jgi:hypothetical protein
MSADSVTFCRFMCFSTRQVPVTEWPCNKRMRLSTFTTVSVIRQKMDKPTAGIARPVYRCERA